MRMQSDTGRDLTGNPPGQIHRKANRCERIRLLRSHQAHDDEADDASRARAGDDLVRAFSKVP